MRSKGESIKRGGGKTSELICDKSGRINTREVNKRLTRWAFAHLVNHFAHPTSKFNLPIAQNCQPSKLPYPQEKWAP